MNRKRAEKFREEVSYLRIDDVIYAPEKNSGILWRPPPQVRKDSGDSEKKG